MPRTELRHTLLAVVALISAVPPSVADGQTPGSSVVTAAGERYRAGLLHRLILGRHYRELWSEPVQVEVLDLGSFAGGLKPLRTGGGMQTRSLRFLGADGREYSFRSVDKDPSPVLDSLLRDTFIDDLVQDGISAAHPYGALVASPLLQAAGVLHVEPQLKVMPDEPALGRFRAEFAGMLGMIEERPDENDGERAPFAGTARVISSERLVERLADGPADRVDAEAFLTARLVDVFLGDWDRHRGQWRWATYDDGEPRVWLPVPTDRDQAFSKFDGLATRIVSLYMPQFVRFEGDYPDIWRLHWNARELDRWFLSGLDRAAWDSVGHRLMARLDDQTIGRAVRRLPPEIYALNGEELASALIARRGRLPDAWDAFYRLLAQRVDVRLTDADDEVTVERSGDGTIVTASVGGDRYFQRRFLDGETGEIRIYMGGGDDRAQLLGGRSGGSLVRLIGGRGDDTFDFLAVDGRVRLYDSHGDGSVEGAGAPAIDRKPYEEWVWSEEDRDQPRDWGRRALPIFWSGYSSDLGTFLGGGIRLESYGFRKRPLGSSFDLRGGFAPELRKGRLEVDGRLYRENSRLFWDLGLRVSRLDVIHYFGSGNGTVRLGGRDFHRVDQTAASATFALGVAIPTGLEASLGIVGERLSTREGAGRFYGDLGPLYGGGSFTSVGMTADLVFDPLGESDATAHRIRANLGASVHPALLDVERTYGKTFADLSTLFATSASPRLALALRSSAESVWGKFPWHQAAFLGGTGSLTGWDEQRFAGDLSLSGGAELRVRAWRPRIVVPVGVGAFGLVEAGRVYLEGASPGGWHTSAGGGVWLQPAAQPYIVRAGVATGEEATKVFVTLGLPY